MATTNEIQEAVQNKLLEADQKELNNIKIRKVEFRESLNPSYDNIIIDTNAGMHLGIPYPKKYLEESTQDKTQFEYLILTIVKSLQYEINKK